MTSLYQWDTDHSLFVLRRSRNQDQWVRLFFDKNREIPFYLITDRNVIVRVQTFTKFSPDRQWALRYRSSVGSSKGRYAEIRAVRLESRHTLKWRVPLPDEFFVCSDQPRWVNDSLQWSLVLTDVRKDQQYLYVGDVQTPKRIWHYALQASPGASLRGETPLQVLGALKDDALLMIGGGMIFFREQGSVRAFLYEIQMKGDQYQLHESSVTLPKGGTVRVCVFTGKTKRLAFLLDFPDYLELLTMNLDGSNVHVLGTYTRINQRYPIEKISWLPSGRRLSFEVNQDLWVIDDIQPSLRTTQPSFPSSR